MSNTQRRVAVIGAGLIGGSIAKALRRHGDEVVLYDHDPQTCRRAAADGFVVAASEMDAAARGDLVILAIPTPDLSQTIMSIGRHLRPGAVVLETGMVKRAPYRVANELDALRSDVAYGCITPMAGSEQSGYARASADLFLDAPFFVGSPEPDSRAVGAACHLIDVLGGGARPGIVDPSEHDMFVALVSQAPQLLAAATTAHLADATVRVGDGRMPVRLGAYLFDRGLRLAGSPPGPAAEAFTDNTHRLRDVLVWTRQYLEELLFEQGNDTELEARHQVLVETRASLEGRFPSDLRPAPAGPDGHAQRVVEMVGLALIGAVRRFAPTSGALADPLAFAGPAFGDSTAFALRGVLTMRDGARGVAERHIVSQDYMRAIGDAERSIETAGAVLREFEGQRASTMPVVLRGAPVVHQQPRGGPAFQRCFEVAGKEYTRARVQLER
jgi:prephenate dehydrogenase